MAGQSAAVRCMFCRHLVHAMPDLSVSGYTIAFAVNHGLKKALCCMQGGEKQGKVQKLSKGEVLMLNIGSMCTGARVIAVSLPLREMHNAILYA